MHKLVLPAMLVLMLAACGHKEEVPAPAPATPQTQAPTPPAPAPEAAAPMAAAPAAAADKGEHVYNNVCTACHGMGVAGAPKMGDKAAWAPRIVQGNDVL
ncbi:MAG: c-type cytochrome [Thiobacillaceae bacterium]